MDAIVEFRARALVPGSSPVREMRAPARPPLLFAGCSARERHALDRAHGLPEACLAVAADRFRGERVAAHIVLTRGERSELAEIAANLL